MTYTKKDIIDFLYNECIGVAQKTGNMYTLQEAVDVHNAYLYFQDNGYLSKSEDEREDEGENNSENNDSDDDVSTSTQIKKIKMTEDKATQIFTEAVRKATSVLDVKTSIQANRLLERLQCMDYSDKTKNSDYDLLDAVRFDNELQELRDRVSHLEKTIGKLQQQTQSWWTINNLRKINDNHCTGKCKKEEDNIFHDGKSSDSSDDHHLHEDDKGWFQSWISFITRPLHRVSYLHETENSLENEKMWY